MKKTSVQHKTSKDIAYALKKSVRVLDFLPSPDKLVLKEDTVKITLPLTKESVAFLKCHAKKQDIPYQSTIESMVNFPRFSGQLDSLFL